MGSAEGITMEPPYYPFNLHRPNSPARLYRYPCEHAVDDVNETPEELDESIYDEEGT